MTTQINFATIDASNEAVHRATYRLKQIPVGADDAFKVRALTDATSEILSALTNLTSWATEVLAYLDTQDDVELVATHFAE